MVDLAGAHILIVEDEPALSVLLEVAVRDVGGTVVGPAPDIAAALAFLSTEPVEAAILDMIVHGDYCDPIAVELMNRNIPFAVTTGIGADASHPLLRDALTITKPFQAQHVQDVLMQLLGSSGSAPRS
jgi:DNA-binding response OmpR family regulator